MPKVIVTVQAENGKRWETEFRKHGDLFRKYSLRAPIHFAVTGNDLTICFEPDNLETFRTQMESPDSAAAMKNDGVKRDTLKVVVLDKEMKL